MRAVPALKLRDALLADGPRDGEAISAPPDDVAAAFAVRGIEREEGIDLPFCSTAIVNVLNLRLRRLRRHDERAGLADGLVGLLDADAWDRFAPGDDVERTGGNQRAGRSTRRALASCVRN